MFLSIPFLKKGKKRVSTSLSSDAFDDNDEDNSPRSIPKGIKLHSMDSCVLLEASKKNTQSTVSRMENCLPSPGARKERNEVER